MRILCVEDGSVDIDALEEEAENGKLNDKILVYRQGSNPPYLIDNKQDLQDIYQEIKENAHLCFTDYGGNSYEIPAEKLREIFEKRLK